MTRASKTRSALTRPVALGSAAKGSAAEPVRRRGARGPVAGLFLALAVVALAACGSDGASDGGRAGGTSSTVGEADGSTVSTTTPIDELTKSCADVGLEGRPEAVTGDVFVSGITCTDAKLVIQQVTREHDFISGPRSFDAQGFACTVETDEDPELVGHYRCNDGALTITWDKS